MLGNKKVGVAIRAWPVGSRKKRGTSQGSEPVGPHWPGPH